MASQFQNRLVGISILVASVVIFLPTVIDGKKQAYEDEFVATPIQPQLKDHRQQLAVHKDSLGNDEQQLQDVTFSPQNDDQWQVEEVNDAVVSKPLISRAEKIVVQRKTTNIATSERAWTIQLGAFENASNINSLLKILHKAGFQAHTVPSQVVDGKLTRLFVGPNVSKAKLEKQLPRLKRLTKLEGKLYPFDAVNP